MDLIFAIASALFTVVGLMLSILAYRQARKREQSGDLDKRFEEFRKKLELIDDALRRVAVLELQVQVFWKNVSFSASQALHSPHTPVLDTLIEKFQQEKINDSELVEFKRRLRDIIADPDETAFRKKSAREVLALIHIRYEMAVAV